MVIIPSNHSFRSSHFKKSWEIDLSIEEFLEPGSSNTIYTGVKNDPIIWSELEAINYLAQQYAPRKEAVEKMYLQSDIAPSLCQLFKSSRHHYPKGVIFPSASTVNECRSDFAVVVEGAKPLSTSLLSYQYKSASFVRREMEVNDFIRGFSIQRWTAIRFNAFPFLGIELELLINNDTGAIKNGVND
ncbi:hypothetical protein BD560DRAFT_488331 [Blakeslea trispora]|nr:hypothetical protein BD560DRAFT_488331 [Blakeslea trispora]